MKKVIRTFTNDTGIDQHVYDRSEELVHVPVGHIFEEFEDGSYVTRPIGAIRRFFDGGGGGVEAEIQQAEAGTDEATAPAKKEPDLETTFRTAATFGLADEEEGGDKEEEKEAVEEEKTYKRSVRELMPLIKAAETLDDLADLKEPKEDRKTIIRALLAKRKELLMAGGGEKAPDGENRDSAKGIDPEEGGERIGRGSD